MKTKRSLITLLALLMLLALPLVALAEEPFTLRNGYYWGMTKEEAMTLAKDERLKFEAAWSQKGEPSLGTRTGELVSYKEVPVGDYVANNFYLDLERQEDDSLLLYAITYLFGAFQSDEYAKANAVFDGLEKGLTAVYGEPDEEESPSTLLWSLPDTTIMLKQWQSLSGLHGVKILYEERLADEPVNNYGF